MPSIDPRDLSAIVSHKTRSIESEEAQQHEKVLEVVSGVIDRSIQNGVTRNANRSRLGIDRCRAGKGRILAYGVIDRSPLCCGSRRSAAGSFDRSKANLDEWITAL